jgi:agmatine deiminase
VNQGIILPVFGEEASEFDDQAEKILKQLHPDRKIIRIDGMALIKEGGNVHCITQQMPKC